MSGWIKYEKDIETDPRVQRMARTLVGRYELCELMSDSPVIASRNAYALPGVTLVCGALIRLWSLADAHARSDDTLDMSEEEVDLYVGIEGFCALMPDDWLRVVDDHTIELPGYQEHNGVEAKKRALTQKRVAQHRENEKRTSVTPRNASALPDQTKTRPIPRPDHKEETMVAARPIVIAHDDVEFNLFKSLYPKRNGSNPWPKAKSAINARLADGIAWPQILDGTRRYAAWCKATQKLNTEHVMQAARFCGPGLEFLLAWDLPATTADVRLTGNLEAAAQAKRELFGSAA